MVMNLNKYSTQLKLSEKNNRKRNLSKGDLIYERTYPDIFKNVCSQYVFEDEVITPLEKTNMRIVKFVLFSSLNQETYKKK